MKPTKAKCRITAVQLGEGQVNLIRPDQVPIKAKFALLSEDGMACGFFEKSNNWSEKTHAKLQELAEAMEEDCLTALFEVGPEDSRASETVEPDEPPQF
jgi:hypothetical protein